MVGPHTPLVAEQHGYPTPLHIKVRQQLVTATWRVASRQHQRPRPIGDQGRNFGCRRDGHVLGRLEDGELHPYSARISSAPAASERLNTGSRPPRASSCTSSDASSVDSIRCTCRSVSAWPMSMSVSRTIELSGFLRSRTKTVEALGALPPDASPVAV